MARGFVYLAVVLNWFSRRVLSWRVSITMEAAFCVETLEEALAKHGKPEICNTDQGSQFTGAAFTGVLIKNGIAISMDGKGAWRDNVFVERLPPRTPQQLRLPLFTTELALDEGQLSGSLSVNAFHHTSQLRR
jgi:transposase InsO family protein